MPRVLPEQSAVESTEAYLRRLVAALVQQARDLETAIAQTAVLSETYPVGALYVTDAAALPPALARLGTWTDAATAAARGAPISANIFERLS